MRKAMQHSFAPASLVICNRHLKVNVIRQLDAVMGSRCTLRKAVVVRLFGDDGVATCTDVITFDDAVDRFRRETLAEADPDIKQYIENRIIVLLQQNTAAGKAGWTNNNSESINHVLKQVVQWRSQKLPELVSRLRTLVDAQFIEADRAMCGRGDYSLVPSHAKFRLTVNAWKAMSSKGKTSLTVHLEYSFPFSE